MGTRFNDNLTGNPSKNQFTGGAGTDVMFGQAGNDTYKGYGSGPASGLDAISDTAGSADKLNLAAFNKGCGDQDTPGPGCNPLFAVASDPGTNEMRHLLLIFADGSRIEIHDYFDGTAPVPVDQQDRRYCASGPGPGLIETIIFADDNVDFAQFMNDPHIGDCPQTAAGAETTASVQQQTQGGIQADVVETSELSTSPTALTLNEP